MTDFLANSDEFFVTFPEKMKQEEATVTVQPPELPAFNVSASFNVTHCKIVDLSVCALR